MTVLVVGLARSGLAAARLLVAEGRRVVAVDSGRPDVEAPGGVEVHLGTDGLAQLDGAELVVKSPGVPREAPVIAEARRRGVEVIGELELAWRRLGREVVAVTGTNGKTTTVELLGHLHRVAGVPVAVAGNVGTALSEVVGTLPSGGVAVVECSSFQLEDTAAFHPQTAVLLNVEPDHLDRHGTFEDYRDAKLRLFANQGPDDVAVAPPDLLPGWVRARRVAPAVLRPEEVRLRGAHNLANAGAAAAAALARGLDPEAVAEGLRTFGGVPHRLEEVAVRDGVTYVNDSKATNVASTLVALAAFAGERVHLLLGGQGKGQSFAPLRDGAAGCASVQLFGEDGPRIAADLGLGALHAGMAEAVAAAREAARAGDVVLLSPACASFDEFRDFEARGEEFRRLAAN